MSVLLEMIADGKPMGSRPWPRALVSQDAWAFAAQQLAQGAWTLTAMWAETGTVHLALFDPEEHALGVMSLNAANGHYPSIGAYHLPARRLERAIHDLYGLIPDGAADLRPWLDHGKWGVHHPLGDAQHASAPGRYSFLPVEGESLHQIPVGPVHASIIEPGHFRFTASGETVVRLEERLGYVHKGIEHMMTGAALERAAKLAARASGDSTVAYSIAFAQAVEAAAGASVPPRAAWLRALMLEMERLANHFGDIGAVCNDAAFSLMHAHCGVLRERVLRAADAAFGHRLMMDRVVPGGVSADLDSNGAKQIAKLVRDARRRFPALVTLYEDEASLQDRTVNAGIVKPGLAAQFGAGGFVGRASNRAFDARRVFPMPPYDQMEFELPLRDRGDVNSRVWVRMREAEQSFDLIDSILEQMPGGDIRATVPARAGEGMAMVESFRGDIFAWVCVDDAGRVRHVHLRDPSWFQWPLLEAAIECNIVADFPLCNKSFNCSYAGHDL